MNYEVSMLCNSLLYKTVQVDHPRIDVDTEALQGVLATLVEGLHVDLDTYSYFSETAQGSTIFHFSRRLIA